MYKDKTIAVVIPTYKASRQILDVISDIPDCVDHVIVVDDCCPEQSGQLIKAKSPSATVLFNKKNSGVGAATLKGFSYAFSQLNCDYAVKIDADGQISPKYVADVNIEFEENSTGYVKGSRFLNLSNIGDMPRFRIFLNTIVSFVTKFSSGYYKISDPTNGLIAITRNAYLNININKVSQRFFFESDMLFHLSINRVNIKDIPMKAHYGDERSNLRFRKEAMNFALGNFRNFAKRVFLRHFIVNFHLPAIYLTFGIPLFLFGFISGTLEWISNLNTAVAASAGQVILPATSVLIGLQMIMQFFVLDMLDEPS